jgi:hypothetical protein
MDKYSIVLNGLPKEFNVECISYFYFYSITQLQYIISLSLNFIISFFVMINVSSSKSAIKQNMWFLANFKEFISFILYPML